jgi:hypothetical protein
MSTENVDLGYVPSYGRGEERIHGLPEQPPRERMALVRVIRSMHSATTLERTIELNFGRRFAIAFEPHEARALAKLLELGAELCEAHDRQKGPAQP